MKIIHFADYSVTTTDRTSDAVISYAQELALVDRSDIVHITGITSEGQQRRFDLLVGPASQIMAESAEPGDGGINDEDDVRTLVALTRHITHPPAALTEEAFPVDDPDLSAHHDF